MYLLGLAELEKENIRVALREENTVKKIKGAIFQDF